MNSAPDSAWIAPNAMLRHTGVPIPSQLTFFIQPSAEIGEIYSADSDLKHPPEPVPFWKMVAWIVGIFGTVTVLVTFVFESWVIVPVMVALALLCIWGASRSLKYTCSFVGSLGLTKGTVPQLKKGKAAVDTFLFQDAIALHTSQTRNYVNGAYTGTAYQYEWKRPAGKSYVLSGTYFSKEGRPREGDSFYLAVATENAWTKHLLPLAIEDFETSGHVSFPMSGKLQMIRIAQGSLAFVLKNGETQTTSVEDMQDIRLAQGRFYFKHKESTWWSGKGKYDFSYQDIPNARLFLICLDRIAGVRFAS